LLVGLHPGRHEPGIDLEEIRRRGDFAADLLGVADEAMTEGPVAKELLAELRADVPARLLDVFDAIVEDDERLASLLGPRSSDRPRSDRRERRVRIEAIRIDGYGIHSDLEINDLPPGLTIVAGPNEAGKTTILDFIRGVLFDFPNRAKRTLPFHEPLRGGRHGGAVTLIDSLGRRWYLERHVGDKEPRLTNEEGEAPRRRCSRYCSAARTTRSSETSSPSASESSPRSAR
jgi:hypothetical protein